MHLQIGTLHRGVPARARCSFVILATRRYLGDYPDVQNSREDVSAQRDHTCPFLEAYAVFEELRHIQAFFIHKKPCPMRERKEYIKL